MHVLAPSLFIYLYQPLVASKLLILTQPYGSSAHTRTAEGYRVCVCVSEWVWVYVWEPEAINLNNISTVLPNTDLTKAAYQVMGHSIVSTY